MDTDALAKLIKRRHDVLVELRELCRRQIRLIDDGDFALLMKLLSAKQKLLSVVPETERELAPFRGQDPNARTWSSAAERDRCRQLAQTSESLLAEIVQLEKQSEGKLVLRRDEAAMRLSGMHSAREAHQAYVQSEMNVITPQVFTG